MSFSHSKRKALAGVCFGLSAVWAIAAAFKLFFGVRVSFPLLPPIDLEQVSPVFSLLVALAFLILGAWLGRTARRQDVAGGALPLAERQAPASPASYAPDTEQALTAAADLGRQARQPRPAHPRNGP